MLDFLDALRGGDRHPLHSVEAAQAVIAELPAGDALRALGDVAQWLRSVADSPDFKPETRYAVVGLLDDAGRKPEREVLLRYFKEPRLRNARGRLAWSAAYAFWTALAAAYRRCVIEQLPEFEVGEVSREPLAAVAARALRAHAGQLRVAMLHYEPVPASLWEGLYAVYARCERAGIAAIPMRAYRAERYHTTPLAELLKALLVAIAAPERLPPEEIEAAFRIAQRFIASVKFETAPFAGATHSIDLARAAPPARLAPGSADSSPGGVPNGPTLRHFGAQEAVARLEKMIGHNELTMLDEDARVAREYSPGQKITVLRHFMGYWSAHPPLPEHGLVRLEGGLGVVHGYRAVCHYVPHVATQPREDMAGGKARGFEVAEALDFDAPETWPERDAGMHVVHAHAGADVGDWAEVGDLTAIRADKRGAWWVAALRRLQLAQGGELEAEFEVLSRKPVSVWLRVLGRQGRMTSDWQTVSGSFTFEYLQSVVLQDRTIGGRPAIIIPKGCFVPEQILELMHGERSRFIQFAEFLEQGRDFDWCSFDWRAKGR